MKQFLKSFLNRLSQILSLPLVILCKLEEILISKDVDIIFNTCTHVFALLPGLPGVFLRRGFYSLALEKCSLNSYIGFGSIFSHRVTTVEEHVYIGSYALIGSSNIGKYCLIGSRASILSGTSLHELDEQGRWTPYSADRLEKITLGKNVWVGEGAIVAADIGEGAMVGAGAVVTSKTKSHIMVTGNPARFVKFLKNDDQ